MNGGIAVADKFLLALAVDVVGPPLFSGPSDDDRFYCPVDRSLWRGTTCIRSFACAQVVQSGEPAFFLRESRLIQSFNVDSAQSPPDVWQRRLGLKAAAQRWQSSNGHRWWMVWLQDGSPLLVLRRTKASEPSRASSMFPDVELLFADDLHRKSFFSKSHSRISTRSILEQVCIDRLTRSPAVAWNPSGLSAIAGSLAFALNSASYGCLNLTLDGRRRLRLDDSGLVKTAVINAKVLKTSPWY